MMSIRIMMRPMDDATLTVPLILTAKMDRCSGRDGDTGGDIDIVANQYRHIVREPHDETLMT